MSSKHADVNQIFILASSMIMVGLLGFLVLQFVSNLEGTTEQINQVKIVDEIELEINNIQKNFGSIRTKTHKIPQGFNEICFMPKTSDCDNEQLQLLDGTANIALLTNNQIQFSSKIAPFMLAQGKQCACFSSERPLEIIYENNDNKVLIDPAN